MSDSVKKLKTKGTPVYAVYLLIFILLLFLCYLFPYTVDDWAWGGPVGIERLNNWFADYSGRYAGNLIVLALTRSNLLKTVTMALVDTGIIVLLNELTGRNRLGFWLITTSMVLMPTQILRQVIPWTSGFANYTVSIFLTLIYIYEVRNLYTQCPDNSIKKSIPLLLLGFGGAMIVEHVTFYNAVLGAWVIFYVALKYRKVRIQHIAYFAGTAAGTLLMLSNGAYANTAKGEDFYRSVAKTGILEKAYTNFTEFIMTNGFFFCCVVVLLTTLVCAALAISTVKKAGKLQNIICFAALAPMLAYSAISWIFCIRIYVKNYSISEKWYIAVATATVIYVLSLFAFIAFAAVDKIAKIKLLFVFCSIFVVMFPLLIVSPINSRCLFASYVFEVYLIAELFNSIDDGFKKKMDTLSVLFIMISMCGMIILFSVYTDIHNADCERIERAREESKTSQVIEVKDLPHRKYVWGSELSHDMWKDRYKQFYGIDENVEIIGTK